MIPNTYPGKFIVVEGLDGSGKSTQVDLLVEFLKSLVKEVVITREPTMDSEAGRTVKKVLKKEIFIEPLALQALYVQDRRGHLQNKVIPALKNGNYVVSSRYAFSTFAYGFSEGLNVDQLIAMNSEFLLPDVTIVVDVKPENCIKRIESRGEDKEFFETIEKLSKVNTIYQQLPSRFENVVVVNGEKPSDIVFEEIKQVLGKTIFNQ